MKTKVLLEKLTEQIGFTPKAKDFMKILGWPREQNLYNRVQRDSEFSDEEIAKIESFYGIELSGSGANCIELEYIHIQPSCGPGTFVLDEADVTPVRIGEEVIKSIWKTAPENLKLFTASGDSMEHTISDLDILLVDISRTDFNNGGVFLITINNDWFVKRLRLRITGELDIISDNEKYPVETLKPNCDVEICVKGRVIKNLSKGL